MLLIHEWWGLNSDIVARADALAKEGFVILVADAAFAYLSGQPRVLPGKVASWGFCFGGSQSQRLATRQPTLAAVVFYGSGPLQTVEDLGLWSSRTPFLGVYGKLDKSISVDRVRAFEAALDAKGIPSTFTLYPGVGHAFVNSTNFTQGGAPTQAWHQAVEFLKTTLGE